MVELVNTGAIGRRPIIAAIGSSSVERSYGKSTGSDTSQASWNEVGWITWANRLSPQVEFRHSHVFGYGGEGGQAFLANIGQVTSALPRAAACLVGISSNDAGFSSELSFASWLATTTGYYQGIIDALKAAGILPILVIQHLRRDYTVGSATWARQSALFSWARRIARIQGGVEVVDLSSTLSDKTSANNFSPASLVNADNIHMSLEGAFRAGVLISSVLARLFPTLPYASIASPGDVWSAENPFGSLIANPGMLGTGGSGGANIPDNWTLGAVPSGMTVTPSKVTDAETGWTRLRLAISGTDAAGGFILLNGSFISGALASLTAGKRLEAFCDYKISGAMTGFRQAGIRFTPTDAGYGGAKNFRDCVVNNSGTELCPVAHSVRCRTPAYTVLNAPSAGAFVFSIDLVAGQANDYTIDIGPAGVIEV